VGRPTAYEDNKDIENAGLAEMMRRPKKTKAAYNVRWMLATAPGVA
jgi:hypothetical protein